ncbi:MAG: D-alanyl-D-alanine carboxypeptidase [Puia sp.]|nr:D-alanyl-D-alanine carboxypeptidase [Puia sp.]
MRQIPLFFAIIVCLLLTGCSSSRVIGRIANRELIGSPDLRAAHAGITLYDPATGKYLYNYHGDKYFTPASNTKLFTLYAGLRYLGDSLPSVRYWETDTALFIIPCGDPTVLHPDFPNQPVISLLRASRKKIYLTDATWKDQPLGAGWAWDDYNDYYMPERSPMPVYGNTIRWIQEKEPGEKKNADFAASPSFYSIPDVDWEVHFSTDTGRKSFFVRRQWDKNVFTITEGPEKHQAQDVPFITHGLESAATLLKDTVGRTVFMGGRPGKPEQSRVFLVRSQPVDSLFTPMMHNSDNFFAEQTLLMAAAERLGIMNDEAIIDTLLNGDLKDLPLKPSWVDGSGLSRFNLFSPMDLVWLLDKMQDTFGLDRMKRILATGGVGTLRNYYKGESGYIFAKTGSLTGVIALSGYLITRKGRLLIFSILINDHRGNGVTIRRSMERLLKKVREKY